MFDGVEYIYKKNSMLNKAARKSLNIYFIIMIVTACSIQFLYKTFNLPILVNIFLIIFLIVFLGTLILCIFFKKLGAAIKFIYNGIMDIKVVFMGEDNLYERLEEIFFQLYIDLKLNENKIAKKNKKSKKRLAKI